MKRFKRHEGKAFREEYKRELEKAKDYFYSETETSKYARKYLKMWKNDVCNQTMKKMNSEMFDGFFDWSLVDYRETFKRAF